MRFALTSKALFFCLLVFMISGKVYATEKPQPSWNFSADFLIWFPSQEVSSIWADVVFIGNNTSSWKAEGFDFNWDYGFRLGAGHRFNYDEWDISFYWTHFHTSAEHSIPFKQNAVNSPEFFAAFLSQNTPQHLRATWSLFFNIFDGELGRLFNISKSVTLRPFLGIKGGWINQPIRAKYYNLTINKVQTTQTGNEHLKNNFWGIGPLGGINTLWRLRTFKFHSFDLFGDFSMATLWGTWHCSDKYKNTVSQSNTVNMKKSTLGALTFRGFVGFGWNVKLHKPSTTFHAKLGYEMQIWLNQLRVATFQLQRLHHDLTLQGVTVSCRFDF